MISRESWMKTFRNRAIQASLESCTLHLGKYTHTHTQCLAQVIPSPVTCSMHAVSCTPAEEEDRVLNFTERSQKFDTVLWLAIPPIKTRHACVAVWDVMVNTVNGCVSFTTVWYIYSLLYLFNEVLHHALCGEWGYDDINIGRIFHIHYKLAVVCTEHFVYLCP